MSLSATQFFAKKLLDFQVTRTLEEANLVWPAFNVQGDEMQFREFVQFLQTEKIASIWIRLKLAGPGSQSSTGNSLPKTVYRLLFVG
jgi:hypothetical protein